jgi:hypothetical protein
MRLHDIFSKKRIIASVAAIAIVAPLSALAAPITGAIGFGGLFTPSGGTGANLSDATGIDISSSLVTTASGDFLPAAGASATYNHIDFSPVNTPITSLWSVSAGSITYSFDLSSLTLDFLSATQISLSGAGTILATGFDDTPGLWTFTGQQGSIFFTFSGITTADDITNAVSEPITLALLMSGLFGIGLSRRKAS